MSESDLMLVAGWKTPVMLRGTWAATRKGRRQALQQPTR